MLPVVDWNSDNERQQCCAPVKIFLENIAIECAEDRRCHRCLTTKIDPSSPFLPIHSPDALISAPHCALPRHLTVCQFAGMMYCFGFWKGKKKGGSRVESNSPAATLAWLAYS